MVVYLLALVVACLLVRAEVLQLEQGVACLLALAGECLRGLVGDFQLERAADYLPELEVGFRLEREVAFQLELEAGYLPEQAAACLLAQLPILETFPLGLYLYKN